MSDATMLKAALFYLKKELPIFPVDKDKKPLVSWKQFQTRLPTEEEVRGWFSGEAGERKMIGLATGKLSGMILMDADSEEAIETYHGYFDRDIDTPTVKTGGGGYHFYFKWYDGCKVSSNNGWSENCDAKGEGGYAVLPPSVSTKGEYRWDKNLKNFNLQDAPRQLIKDINDAAGRKFQPSKAPAATGLQFSEGGRDDSLFHTANSLIKGGMDHQNVRTTIRLLGAGCDPPMSQEECDIKVDSAIKRAGEGDSDIGSKIRQWVDEAGGTFRMEAMWGQLGITEPEHKSMSRSVLRQLCEEKVIDLDGKLDGVFKKIGITLTKMKRIGDISPEVKMWLPFGLHHKVTIRPGTLILVAGVSNAGKSAFFLNFAEMNKEDHRLRYVTSEWDNEERDGQLRDFGVDIDEWDDKIDFYYKDDTNIAFDNYIKPEGITLVDYYECYEEQFKAGGDMRKIADKLTTGVAIVGLQKHPDSTHGYGGAQTAFRSQLYINIETNEDDPMKKTVYVVKLKKPRGSRRFNIERLSCEFEYDDYGRICNQGPWGKWIVEKERGQPETKRLEPQNWANHDPKDPAIRKPLESDVSEKQVAMQQSMFEQKEERVSSPHDDEDLGEW